MWKMYSVNFFRTMCTCTFDYLFVAVILLLTNKTPVIVLVMFIIGN